MKKKPPRWIDRFLEWYCVPDRLEEIQGDAHELYFRRMKKNPAKAKALFAWDVLRFLRWKNIRKSPSRSTPPYFPMLKNILLVAFRNIRRQPGHSVLNVVGLAAGFTCCMLIFLWVSQEFSFEKPNSNDEQIFRVLTHARSDKGVQTYDVASMSMDVSSIPEIKSSVAVSTGSRWPHELCFRPEANPDACVYLKGIYAGENFFTVFAFPSAAGENSPVLKHDQIAISEKMAIALFGTTDPIGKPIKIDGRGDVAVISVFKNLPVTSSLQFEFVMPFNVLQRQWGATDQQFTSNFFHVYLKTAAAVKAAVLTPKLNDSRVLIKALADDNLSYAAYPLSDWHLKSKFENGTNTGGRIEYVQLFAGIALLVIAMAVINFINMTTSLASTRAKEIGIRKVTGAYRSGIIAQFLGESFITVLAAFAIALVLAHFSLPFFNTLLPEPVALSLYSGKIILYLTLFLLAVALLAGIYPAFVLSSYQPVTILKDKFTGTMTGSNRLRKSLLVVQLSVSLGIIMFSGVIYWQLNFIGSKDLGYDRLNMIHLEPTINVFRKMDVFKEDLLKGNVITGITASNANPLDAGGANTGVSWPGKRPDARVAFSTIACTYEFPETFGLKLAEGRYFLPKSQDSLNTEVMVTRDAITAMNLQHPIGEHITIGNAQCVIIGVVNDFHTGPLRDQRLPVILHRVPIYNTGGVYIKYKSGHLQEALHDLQQAYTRLEPNYTMKFDFQDDTFAALYKTEQTASRLAIVFTIVTLIIALIGIIGLATFTVFRKTKEIGIRRVFGATPVQILTMLSTEFSWVMYIALLIAAPLTWYFGSRWLQTFAYHITMPWWWYAVSFAGIAVLTISIICLQALKTVASNPTDALRVE